MESDKIAVNYEHKLTKIYILFIILHFDYWKNSNSINFFMRITYVYPWIFDKEYFTKIHKSPYTCPLFLIIKKVCFLRCFGVQFVSKQRINSFTSLSYSFLASFHTFFFTHLSVSLKFSWRYIFLFIFIIYLIICLIYINYCKWIYWKLSMIKINKSIYLECLIFFR